MVPDDGLDEFYFGQPALFVVPIEALGPGGMSDAFARRLQRRRGIGPEWRDRFDTAFRLAWTRGSELSQWAADQWLPPRLQHVCVVTEPAVTRPLFLPLPGASWLVYADDFDPARSESPEWGAFVLVLAERLAQTRDLPRAFAETLGYWLPRDDAEAAAFVRDARGSARPDAAAFVALADALPAIRALYHPTLRRPPATPSEPLRRVGAAGVLAPASAADDLRRFTRAVREAAQATAAAHLARSGAGPSGASSLRQWIRTRAPRVVVVDEAGATVWDPDAPAQTDALQDALGDIAEGPAGSLREDLATIDLHTRAVFAALADPDRLGAPSELVDQADGVYLHAERRLIAYSLRQPGLDPRREVGPPFHRWLLEARTVHEWGHLLEEAGHLGVQPDAADAHARARDRVAAAFEALVAAGPAGLRDAVAEQPAARSFRGTPGELVTELVVGRMSDYAANLFARRLLSRAAMQSYLRTNVPAHANEGLDPLSLVARHAYEFQYLRLAEIDDPWTYFLRSTWIEPLYVATGLLQADRLRELFDAVGELAATYGIDPAALR